MVGGSAFWFVARLPLLGAFSLRSCECPPTDRPTSGPSRWKKQSIEFRVGWTSHACALCIPRNGIGTFSAICSLPARRRRISSADAHLAALAIEYGCELNSTDADFARFPKLAWKNPLQ